MRKDITIVLTFILVLVCTTLVSSETYKANTPINYKGSCINGVPTAGCDCTLTITNPQGSFLFSNKTMTDLGTGFYNYTFTASSVGAHKVVQSCKLGYLNGTEVGIIDITPSGNDRDSSNISLFIVVILIIYGMAFVGFFGKNVWVAILGGMGMIALGLYTINNGVVIYKDFITNVFSWTTIGIGAIFAITAGIEIVQDNL